MRTTESQTESGPEKLVIVGGGFAGTTLAQHAERLLDSSVTITVVSRDNHLVFTPMLPELAGRSASVDNIAVPGRSITKRTSWLEANVTRIDEARQTVEYETTGGARSSLAYTHLVIACGSEATLDAIPGLKAHGLSVKTAGDALRLGNEIIARFEAAASERDEVAREAILHAVVIGGGFSGVEVAGQINDLMTRLRKSYPEVQGTAHCVTILQRGTRVIPEFDHKRLSEFTLGKLRKNGIEVLLETSAKEVTNSYILLDSDVRIPTRMVICTIGTQTVPLIEGLGLKLEKGRIQTESDMRVPGRRNLWSIGDCAVTVNEFDRKPTPPTAQFAIREAGQLATNIALAIKGQPTKPFRFRPQGLLASIGRQNGVAEIYGFQFSGFLAWLLWRAVYLLKIPGLGNKIGVAIDWLADAVFTPSLARIRLPGDPQPRKIHYGPGDLVFDSANAGNTAHFIANGKADLLIGDAKQPHAKLEKGDYFGKAIFHGDSKDDPRIRIQANTSLDVIEVDGQAFLDMSQSFSPLNAQVAGALKARTILGRLLREQTQHPNLAALRVEQVMGPAQDLFGSEITLDDALERFRDDRPGYWVAAPDGKLVGFLGRMELYEALACKPGETPISEAVRKAPPLLMPDQDLFSATLALLRSGFDNIPVAKENCRVVGLYDPLALLQHREQFGGEPKDFNE